MQRVEAQREDDRRLAEYILQWVSFAVRPLSLNDLQEALIVEPDSDGVDETNIRDAELLTSVCAEFVVVDQYGKVRLVHSSKLEIFEYIIVGSLSGIRLGGRRLLVGESDLQRFASIQTEILTIFHLLPSTTLINHYLIS